MQILSFKNILPWEDFNFLNNNLVFLQADLVYENYNG